VQRATEVAKLVELVNMNDCSEWVDANYAEASFSSNDGNVNGMDGLAELPVLAEEPMDPEMIVQAFRDNGFWLPSPTISMNDSIGSIDAEEQAMSPGMDPWMKSTASHLQFSKRDSLSLASNVGVEVILPLDSPMLRPDELERNEVSNVSANAPVAHSIPYPTAFMVCEIESFQGGPMKTPVAMGEVPHCTPIQSLPGITPTNTRWHGIFTVSHPLVRFASAAPNVHSDFALGNELSHATGTPYHANGWWTLQQATSSPPFSSTLDPIHSARFQSGDIGSTESVQVSGSMMTPIMALSEMNQPCATALDTTTSCKGACPSNNSNVVKAPLSSRAKKRRGPGKGKTRRAPPTPDKPLTAYNFFFKFERERLLKYCEENPTVSETELLQMDDLPSEYNEHYDWTVENSADFQTKFLQDHWNRSKVKRSHRKSHGRIAFASLTKYIARSWKERLPNGCKDVFAVFAERDAARWRRDMARRCKALQHCNP
jgi:hypothetical protein